MKKFALVIVIASVIPLSLRALRRSNPEIALSDPRGDAIEAVEQTYQNTATLQAEFVQTTTVLLLEKTLTRPGRIFYEKGGKLRIEYSGDKMTHYITDGNTLWVIDPQTKQVDLFSLKDAGLPEEALKFMTELGHLRKYFEVRVEKNSDLVLKPKAKSNYRSLYCAFNKDHYLKGLTIRNRSGNISKYRFFNIKTGIQFPGKLFQP